jgi:hypothetical protein
MGDETTGMFVFTLKVFGGDVNANRTRVSEFAISKPRAGKLLPPTHEIWVMPSGQKLV